jgi:hypothetical protein
MNEAVVTSASKKIVPLNVSGMISQLGRLKGAVARMTIQTDRPRMGIASNIAGNVRFAVTFAAIAVSRIVATIANDIQSMCRPRAASFTIGE